MLSGYIEASTRSMAPMLKVCDEVGGVGEGELQVRYVSQSAAVVRKKHYQRDSDRRSLRVVGTLVELGARAGKQRAGAKRERRTIAVRSVRREHERADRVPVSESADLEQVNCGMGRTGDGGCR